ncbi:hypothetical protein CCR81_00540 [Halorhodospira halophila]|nr:hypothetical protein [Halorhodospira halophila]
MEWVAGFVWNQWQPWSGIRTIQLGYPTLALLSSLLVSRMSMPARPLPPQRAGSPAPPERGAPGCPPCPSG